MEVWRDSNETVDLPDLLPECLEMIGPLKPSLLKLSPLGQPPMGSPPYLNNKILLTNIVTSFPVSTPFQTPPYLPLNVGPCSTLPSYEPYYNIHKPQDLL